MRIDATLIEGCAAHERKAQQQLYQLLLPYLRAVARRYLRNDSYLLDALQESFVKIFSRIQHFDATKGTFRAWAVTIVVRTCLDFNRRIMVAYADAWDEADLLPRLPAEALPHLTDEYLLSLLRKMPPDYEAVFNLFVIDEYSHEEISQLLNISEVLSRKRLSRAKSWLRDHLQHPYNTDTHNQWLKQLYE